MKFTKFYLLLFCFLTSCSLFEDKEKKAIEICQKAKVELKETNALAELYRKAQGISDNTTWLDYVNKDISKDPNDKYLWKAEKTYEKNIYVVAFVNQESWGRRWEVDIEEKTVKYINDNEYLSRKHGLSRYGGRYEFEITDIIKSGLKIDNQYRNSFDKSGSDITYEIKASVLNKTDKTITDAEISGKLKLIFKDKVIDGESSNWSSGFERNVSESNPWEPNTKRDFKIYTRGIKNIYLNYDPEYIVFDISLKAKDPVGFKFDKDILDEDLKQEWRLLRENPSGKPSSNENENSSSSTEPIIDSVVPATISTENSIGSYVVNATNNKKVYFHNSPNASTIRKAHFDSQEQVYVKKIENGFGYVEFTNSNQQTSYGWLEMRYLIKQPN